jgi:hypothetical protein
MVIAIWSGPKPETVLPIAAVVVVAIVLIPPFAGSPADPGKLPGVRLTALTCRHYLEHPAVRVL